MKRLLLVAVLFTGYASAQFTPTPIAAYTSTDGVTWFPDNLAASYGALSFTPEPRGLYCQASANAAWTPCVFSGGGGSGNATQVNGAAVPASSPYVGTNANGQIVSASAPTQSSNFTTPIHQTVADSNGTANDVKSNAGSSFGGSTGFAPGFSVMDGGYPMRWGWIGGNSGDGSGIAYESQMSIPTNFGYTWCFNDALSNPTAESVGSCKFTLSTSQAAFTVPLAVKQIVGVGNVPTCTVTSGSGTGATCSVSSGSTGLDFELTLNTGTGTTASTSLVYVTYGALTVQPIDCSPKPHNATAVGQVAMVYAARPTTSVCTISVAAAAIPASTTYVWGVHVE